MGKHETERPKGAKQRNTPARTGRREMVRTKGQQAAATARSKSNHAAAAVQALSEQATAAVQALSEQATAAVQALSEQATAAVQAKSEQATAAVRAKAAPTAMVLAATATAIALAGCGSSGTQTVSVASTTPTEAATQPTTTTGTTQSSPPTTTQTKTGVSTNQTGGAEATRTGSAPAFTKESASAEGVNAAAAVVRAHGYTPNETSQYQSNQTLHVLVGTRTGSSNGYGQQAFFFVDGHYLGTDTSQPSATVKVLSQGDTEVTLSYPIYNAGDPLGKPSGGEKTVRFQLNNGRLVPLGQIPSAAARSGE
jgi:LppP/LprE lipoprotein